MMTSKAPLYFPYHPEKRVYSPSELTTTGRAFKNPATLAIDYHPLTKPTSSPPSYVSIANRVNVPQEPYESTTKETYKRFDHELYSKERLGKHAVPLHLSVFGTHLKFPSDTRHNGFITTNREMYSPKQLDCTRIVTEYDNRMKYQPTYNLLGTKTVAPPPLLPLLVDNETNKETEYLTSYVQHPLNSDQRKINQEIENKLMKDHVKGGIEAYTGSQFATTMDDAFQYTGQPESVQLSRLTTNEKNGITSIPFGDREKERSMASEQMISYKLKNETEEKGSETPAGVYNKKEAHDKTYKSSIKMMADNSKSSFNKKNDYPQYPITVRQGLVRNDRNLSSFPPGDLCPERVRDRMMFLNSRDFSKPPPNSFPTYANKSHLRTHSNVHFGSTSLFGFPLTTSLESYKPKIEEVHRATAPTTDNIVFPYKPDKPLISTVKESYDVKKVKQRSVNQKYLKDSHWRLPVTEVSFATTHQTHFIPPPISSASPYNNPHLSSTQ